jgi:hypothetical protein
MSFRDLLREIDICLDVWFRETGALRAFDKRNGYPEGTG